MKCAVLLYHGILMAFSVGSIIGSYLTYTTENAWLSFFWFCIGLLLGNLIFFTYEIVKEKRDKDANL